MDKIIFLLIFWPVLGQGLSSDLNVNGTVYYNVTGELKTSEDYTQSILERESNAYRVVRKNLTTGFLRMFSHQFEWIFYEVNATDVFIWPSLDEREKYRLSFVLIVKYMFKTTASWKGRAEEFFNILFRHRVNEIQDEQGYVRHDELRVKYEDVAKLQEQMLENITMNYMAFITKLKKDDGKGDGKGDGKKEEIGGNVTQSDNSTTNQDVSNISTRTRGESREVSYVAYTGIILSTIGLLITMFSICYFRRLRRFRRNQILVHICATIMSGMLLSVLAFHFEGSIKYCRVLAQLLHYFILAALSWMCVEAYNLYVDVVRVFHTNAVSGRVFTIRSCLFAYGMPAIIVGITSSVNVNVYRQRNDACWMTSTAFLLSFLAPVLLVLAVNIIFFSLIMREIIQTSQRDHNNIRPSLRAAVSLSVVFGFCWLLAGFSTFTSNVVVTYAFVITSSFQGLFIFIFHGVGKKELRDSWKTLPIFQRSMLTSNESKGRRKTESGAQDAQRSENENQQTQQWKE